MTTIRRRYLDTSLIRSDVAETKARNIIKPAISSNGIAHCISFYLSNIKVPIVVRNEAEFTIGRCDLSKRFTPTVDLSQYDARKLGVSRYHASIIYKDNRFYIKDLNSKNGTWLNYIELEPQLLAPIQVEDIIQLGYLTLRVG